MRKIYNGLNDGDILFIRTVGIIRNKLDDSSDALKAGICSKYTNSDGLFIPVSVLPDDTIAAVRTKLSALLEAEDVRAKLSATVERVRKGKGKLDQNMIGRAVEKWENHEPSDSILDENALPFSEEKGVSPTQWLVQVIVLDSMGCNTELYIELMDSAEKSVNFDTRGKFPVGFGKADFLRMPDGRIFVCPEDIKDEGLDSKLAKYVSFADLVKTSLQ